jgi:hypothetical protein
MSRESRRFELGPNEYVVFRFSVRRSRTLYIRMLATSPVNLLVMDPGNYADYKSGDESYSIERWSKRIALEEEIDIWPGTWYIVIEGREQQSSGWLEVYH